MEKLNYEKILLKLNLAESYMNLYDRLPNNNFFNRVNHGLSDKENCLKKTLYLLDEIRENLKDNAD